MGSHGKGPGSGKHSGWGVSKGGKDFGSAFRNKGSAKNAARWNDGRVQGSGCMLMLLMLPFYVLKSLLRR